MLLLRTFRTAWIGRTMTPYRNVLFTSVTRVHVSFKCKHVLIWVRVKLSIALCTSLRSCFWSCSSFVDVASVIVAHRVWYLALCEKQSFSISQKKWESKKTEKCSKKPVWSIIHYTYIHPYIYTSIQSIEYQYIIYNRRASRHTKVVVSKIESMRINWSRVPNFLICIFLGALLSIVLRDEFGLNLTLAVPLSLFLIVQLQKRGLLG